MCFFELIAALFQNPSPHARIRKSISVESSTLGRLPPEILIHVAGFLPIASAASFALCCCSIRDILATRYWVALRTEGQQQARESFLSLLERDLPNYIICYHCSILHSGNKARYENRIEPSTRPRHRHGVAPCYKEDLLGGVPKYIHKDFSFNIFHMTMKCYRLGLDYNHHLNLLANKTTSRRSMEGFPYQCVARAQIIAGSVILRVQEVLLIPSDRVLEIPTASHVAICPHIGNVAQAYEARLPENAQCTIDHSHSLKQCVRQSG